MAGGDKIMIPNKPNYRIKEVAWYIGVSRSTVKRWINSGSLESIRFPTGEHRITTTALQKILLQLKVQHRIL